MLPKYTCLVFQRFVLLKDEELTPIDGAVGALIRLSFTFVFWSVAGICFKKKKKKNTKRTKQQNR